MPGYPVGRALFSSLILAAAALAQPYAITTVAGGEPPAATLPPAQASIGDPPRVAADPSDNIYFGSLHSIFRIDRSGALARIAGTGRSGNSGDGGPATAAQFLAPSGIAVDSTGNLFVADMLAHVVRRVAADGTISTYAGNGAAGFSGDGGMATAAQLKSPDGLALDAAGNLYIADRDNNRIRVVSPDGHIATFAGNGVAGFSGDAGSARDAALDSPEAVAIDAAGNLYIADTQNYRIRKVDANGIISTFAGTGNGNVFGDGGPAVSAGLVLPTAVAVDRLGRVYIADFGNSRIRVVTPDGNINTAAGNNAGTPLGNEENAISVRLSGPTGLAVDSAGNIFFTEGSIGSGSGLAKGDFRVWKVSPDSILTIFAGNGLNSYSGDNGSSAKAQLDGPSGIAIDSQNNLYVADTQNHRIRKITPGGAITTFAGTGAPGFSGDGGPAAKAQLDSPQGVAVAADGSVVIADTGNSRIRVVSTDGTINSYIGNGNASYFGDGGRDYLASLNHPQGVAAAPNGDIYVADTRNNAVRKRTTDGFVRTVAGTGPAGYAGDNGQATSALLNGPTSVAVDSLGNVYIVDAGNQRLREVTPDGTIRTIAAGLAAPRGVAANPAGGVIVTTAGDHRVLLAGGNRQPVAIAGTGECCYSGDGGSAGSARLDTPWGVAVDSTGDIFVSDQAADAVRALLPTGSVPTVTNVVNGASNLAGPITPGEVVVLFGTQLGPAQLVIGQPGGDGQYPSQLAGTAVLFNGIPAQIVYTSALQLSAIVPAGLSGSSAQATVENGNLQAASLTLGLTSVSPGIFTADGSGRGQAAATNADGTPNSTSHPATSSVTLYATGLAAGQTLTATIGGRPAAVLTDQPQGGIWKLTLQVPAGVNGAIPVTIRSGDSASQDGVTVALAGN